MEQTTAIEEVQPETKKMIINRPSANRERIKQDEAELAALMEKDKVVEEVTEETDENLSKEEKTFKKRYGDLRRHMQTKDKEFQDQINQLRSQLEESTKQEIKLPKSEEDIEEWAKKYPDVAGIVETIAIKKAKEQANSIEERVKELSEMQKDVTREKAETELLQFHPDFNEIKETDEFHEWADEQPKWVQDALYENENDARSAARAIDLYKSDKGIGKKRVAKNDAAKSVSTKGSRTSPETNEANSFLKESEVNRMSTKEYEKNADVIMEAIRSNKFIYDISGTAR
tara:strand:+ start:468 stop:1328 length:861 start_codon:yes stop_codon:yes gene_type:complete